MLVDLCTQTSSYVWTGKSDVLSQCFSADSQILFNGTRNGSIWLYDVRTSSRKTTNRMSLRAAVCWLHTLQRSGGVYMLAGGYDNQLSLWDLRMFRPVIEEFPEHANKISDIRGCTDDAENIVFCGGEDGLVRGWNLITGQLILETDPFDMGGDTSSSSASLSSASTASGPRTTHPAPPPAATAHLSPTQISQATVARYREQQERIPTRLAWAEESLTLFCGCKKGVRCLRFALP